jgi:hypothetical protein
VLWYAEFESIIRVQREFRREFCLRLPGDKSIRRWHEQFRETGSVGEDIVLGSLGGGVEEVELPSKCRGTIAPDYCPQNSSEQQPTSKTIPTRAQKFWNTITAWVTLSSLMRQNHTLLDLSVGIIVSFGVVSLLEII